MINIENIPVSIHRRNGVTVATVQSSELDANLPDALWERLLATGKAGSSPRVMLDLSSVKFMDSLAVGSLVMLQQQVKQSDGRLAVVGVTGQCLRILKVTGLTKVIQVCPNIAAAMETLQQPN